MFRRTWFVWVSLLIAKRHMDRKCTTTAFPKNWER